MSNPTPQPGQPEVIDHGQHPLFRGTVGIVSADGAKYPSMMQGHDALSHTIHKLGLQGVERSGHDGQQPHRVWVVHSPTREQMYHLGRAFGQESVIFGHDGNHELLFTNGPNAGRMHQGAGHDLFDQPPPGQFLHLPELGGYFRLRFDHGRLFPAQLPQSSLVDALKVRALHNSNPGSAHNLRPTDPPALLQKAEGTASMSDQKEFSLPEVGAEIAKKIRERIDQYGQEMLALRQRELKKSEQASKCPLCGCEDKPGSCKCLDKPLESLAKGSQYVSPVKRFGQTVPKGQSVEPKPEDWKPEMKQVQGEETKKAELCSKCGKQCGTSDLAKCGETEAVEKGELKDARVKGSTDCNGCISGWPGSGKAVHQVEHHGVKIALCDHCNNHLSGLKGDKLKKAVGDMAPNAGNGAPKRIKIAPVKSAPAAPPQATGSAKIAQVSQQPIAPMGLGAPKSRSPILAKAGLNPQMKQHAAIDGSKAAAAGGAPAAPKTKMPTPAEHAQRAAGFADFTPKAPTAPKLPKAPSAAPAPTAPAAPKPGIFGKLASKKS